MTLLPLGADEPGHQSNCRQRSLTLPRPAHAIRRRLGPNALIIVISRHSGRTRKPESGEIVDSLRSGGDQRLYGVAVPEAAADRLRLPTPTSLTIA